MKIALSALVLLAAGLGALWLFGPREPARSALASWRWAEKVTRPAQFGAGVGCA